ncbi:large ribosomal subunit protein bL33m [Salvelinus sp. IW2-2015]|uniref:large ribosomal subunit protein bL33m n=1 Tax=Salvelinus sp. IW2-2015 TaxID=2691554 RepID=UPI0038D4CF1E
MLFPNSTNWRRPIKVKDPIAQGGFETQGLQLDDEHGGTVLVQMVSAAGTGYCFNTKRNRLREKLVLRKNDPLVNKHVLFHEKKKIRSI